MKPLLSLALVSSFIFGCAQDQINDDSNDDRSDSNASNAQRQVELDEEFDTPCPDDVSYSGCSEDRTAIFDCSYGDKMATICPGTPAICVSNNSGHDSTAICKTCSSDESYARCHDSGTDVTPSIVSCENGTLTTSECQSDEECFPNGAHAICQKTACDSTFSGCCKVKTTLEDPWRRSSRNSCTCKEFNQILDDDNMFRKTGRVWWDLNC